MTLTATTKKPLSTRFIEQSDLKPTKSGQRFACLRHFPTDATQNLLRRSWIQVLSRTQFFINITPIKWSTTFLNGTNDTFWVTARKSSTYRAGSLFNNCKPTTAQHECILTKYQFSIYSLSGKRNFCPLPLHDISQLKWKPSIHQNERMTIIGVVTMGNKVVHKPKLT